MPINLKTLLKISPLFLILLSLFILSGCSSDAPGEIPSGTIVAAASGTNNVYLPDVDVSTNIESSISNDSGWSILEDIPVSDRVVVFFEKENFVSALKITDVQKNKTTQVFTEMSPATLPAEPDAGSNATINDGTGEITIFANSLVYDDMGFKDDEFAGTPFSGIYECSFTAVSPSEENGKELFPDGFQGYTLDNPETLVPLVAYGFVALSLRDNELTDFPVPESDNSPFPDIPQGKRRLIIEDGRFALIKIPIPPDLPNPPDTMGAWNVSKDDGYWYQVDTLTRSGNVYVGETDNFSFLVAAEPYIPSTVNGRILDYEQGDGLEDVEVIINGEDTFNAWRQVQKYTGADGSFSIDVYPNSNARIHVLQNGNAPEIGDIFFTTPSAGGEDELPHIALCTAGTPPCPTYLKVRFTLEWNKKPRNLNAMLAMPTFEENGSKPLLWYHTPDMGSAKLVKMSNSDSEPNTEIIEIYDLRAGTYKFSVHHYDGAGKISKENGVKATLVVEDYNGEIITETMTPVSGANGINDIWRVWDLTVKSSRVTDIAVVNSISNNETAVYK